MPFSCKIILSEYLKQDGKRQVYLQAIIDQKRALMPLGFYIEEKFFDARSQLIKQTHPNHDTFNKEISKALADANNIASRYRLDNKKLNPRLFINEFKNPSSEMDLINFMMLELELKRPSISFNTWKQHNSVINKLKTFQSYIRFGDINFELIQEFKNKLIKDDKNSPPTVTKILKIVKHYFDEARKKGYKIDDAFKAIKLRSFRSNRLALSQGEVNRMEQYYDDKNCNPVHQKVLRYFLFSCYTGLRISDIRAIRWNQVHDDVLIFVPEKTKKENRTVTMPLLKKDRKFIGDYLPGNGYIFDTLSDQRTNKHLKAIASKLDIKKNVTYHTSRHTFGSLFAEGGDINALQKLMGHGSITTTMGYVHTSTKALIDAKKKRFGD